MNRWLVLPLLVSLALAGCTGTDDGDTDPTPEPTPSATPSPTPTRATPTPTSTPAPTTATPSATPTTTPPTATPPTGPAPSTKAVNFTFAFTAGESATGGLPGIPGAAAGGNCGGFAPATILGGNATATYEAGAIPVGGPGEVELILLAPDGTVLTRVPGPSPISLTIPAVALGQTGVKLVVQHVEEPSVPATTDVSVEVILILPASDAAPAQDAVTTCERVE